MADVALRRGGNATWASAGLVLAALAAVAVALRLLDPNSVAGAQNFLLIFSSLLIEAVPFVLLGAVVSAAIEVFVPARAFDRVARLPLPLQLPGAALGGLAFPVCECGSVPVARRLIARGVHPAAGIAFMLASPILNPIVLLSTWIAYRGRGVALEMVLGRAAVGLLLAVAAGWALGNRGASELLRARPGDDRSGHAHDGGRARSFVDHLAGDFFHMGRFVVAGAALAAAMQTVIPQSVVSGVATTPVVGALALMAIAFVLSLCSEADAFVAVSLTPFPLGAQLAFMTFGPVVDTKLALLYGATFRDRFVVRLVAVAVPVVLAGSLWFEAVVA